MLHCLSRDHMLYILISSLPDIVSLLTVLKPVAEKASENLLKTKVVVLRLAFIYFVYNNYYKDLYYDKVFLFALIFKNIFLDLLKILVAQSEFNRNFCWKNILFKFRLSQNSCIRYDSRLKVSMQLFTS